MRRIAETVRTIVFLVPVGVLAASMALSPASAEEPSELSAEDLPVEAIEGIIGDYILKNPEVVGEAMKTLRKRERAAKAEDTTERIAERRDEIFNDPDSPVGGNPEGDVTIVEFFDYNCSYCRRTASVLAEIERADPGVRLIYKEYPILGSSSVLAAQAALAARAQGKYLDFHKALMEEKGVLSLDRIMRVAESVGLDTARLYDEIGDPLMLDAIDRNRALARALGIRSTPSFVIGDRVAKGAKHLEALKRLIELARSK